ncbi:MAG TPA: UDP-N-acetylmuramate dehydrogenase [Porticoccaceae bacterium]|nr:UDP-N-acetylmuramate dehydrogenase [Porticoccaceae bacterium]HIK80070.1 UDP-N-acetylmuramate dehydrogenase [Porticoccaceae bacterium]
MGNLQIETKKSLLTMNTMALPSTAEYFCSTSTIDEVQKALSFARKHNLAVTPLGAGSNVVLASNLSGLVVHLALKGWESVVPQGVSTGYVDVTFAAGENWHDMVLMCLERGWYGLENLSLIPGNMGAAAIQNIGAYGVELSSRLVSLQVIDIHSGTCSGLDREACQFSYRDSVFKQSLKDKCIITHLTLRLSTEPNINIDYPALNAYFVALDKDPTPQLVSNAVCKIRREKLPDPNELANVGSFFKNPVIARSALAHVQAIDGSVEVPFYPQADGSVKVPAAWLIDQCQFRGVRRGDVGVHDKQALVLVNYSKEGDNNSAKEVLALAKEIQAAVKVRFGIDLEVEPRIYGSF